MGIPTAKGSDFMIRHKRSLNSCTTTPCFPGSAILEAGCGVGAQTVILAKKNPGSRFTSIDVSPDSVAAARTAVERAGLSNVRFQTADIFHLPFGEATFDHVFVCFVGNLPQPGLALAKLKKVLKPGGTLTVIEGDHGSTFFHPHSSEAWRTIQCQIDLQAAAGGNALIGRQLFPLLQVGWFLASEGLASICLCGFEPPCLGGGLHQRYLYCDDRGRARPRPRCRSH